jgi:hypothetical protein
MFTGCRKGGQKSAGHAFQVDGRLEKELIKEKRLIWADKLPKKIEKYEKTLKNDLIPPMNIPAITDYIFV